MVALKLGSGREPPVGWHKLLAGHAKLPGIRMLPMGDQLRRIRVGGERRAPPTERRGRLDSPSKERAVLALRAFVAQDACGH